MKLVRTDHGGKITPAALDGDVYRDLSSLVDDIDAAALSPDALDRLRGADLASLPELPAPDRIAPPRADIRRIFCIGLNYSDHAAEAGMKVPDEPILFMKVCPATGPNDPIIIPKASEKTDWEVELGVVIGSTTQHVSEADALAHVAGYTVVNDVSEREFQAERGGQWVKGKSCDSFGPVGPWLVTADEVADPQKLDMYLDVNGERRQTGTTATMVFGVAHLVSYLSRFITLQPGDLISTGTPPGVAMGMKPPKYLRPGDTVRLGISGLGDQEQPVVAYPG